MNIRSPADLNEEWESSVPGGEGNAPRPLTVMQVVPSLETGGVERGTIEMTEAIVNSGGRALVLTSGGVQAFRITKAGGELILMDVASKNPLNILWNARKLARIIREQEVDIVHARSRAPAWSAWLACRKTGAAFVTTYHGTYSEDLPFKRLYNSVMARGKPVIAISNHIRELVIERHNLSDDDIVVIPRGADIAVFSEERVGNERTITLAAEWGILDDPRPVVMLPGRLTRWKGAETLIDAAAILKETRRAQRAPEDGEPDFLILIVGDGDQKFTQALDKRIESAGVQDCVHRTGNCTDMAAAYKLASVVVSASIEPEAFGRVAVEAQAMGRPVIATDHGGARETVQHEQTGWLYPPGDAGRLAEVIGKALDMDASARAHMGLAARARIHTQYTIAAMQRATLNVYEDVAGRPFGQTG